MKTALDNIGTVRLKGILGARLDAMIERNVAAKDIDAITAPFLDKTETRKLWQTEFWGKWMHSAVPFLAYSGHAALREKIGRGIDRILASQEEGGYIGNYPDALRFGEGWDVWGIKYTMMGLLHWHDATHSEAALAACRRLRPDADILAADTLVWFEGRLVGKPRDEEEAARFLRAFSGRTQTVFTAVAFSRPADAKPTVRIEATAVRFKELTDAEIADYIRVVHPLDRAGAYDAADYGDRVIAEVVGSFTNVVGLPMETVREIVGPADRGAAESFGEAS